MLLTEIDHVAIAVNDLEAAVDYYRETFGCEVEHREVVERDGKTVLSYGPVGGYAPLREWIADRHGVDAARVLITNGSLQGFVFLAERLPGQRVLVEQPTYDRPLKILRRVGVDVVPVAMSSSRSKAEAGAH